MTTNLSLPARPTTTATRARIPATVIRHRNRLVANMLHTAYALLLLSALWANKGDKRMLTLTFVVGVSLFLPAPKEWPNYYYFCGFAEIIVALVALSLNTAASVVIAEICVVMVITHVMGYYNDGYPPFSPYRVIVKALESLEILCCILASAPLQSRLRNRESK